MDLSEFPDIEMHDCSASYTTVPQQLFPSFDFGISQRPFSLELQQQHELATEDYIPPEAVSHGPISLETVPDATCFGPNLTQLAQPQWPSSMSTILSALTSNPLSEQHTVDAMDAELFQLVQPIGSSVNRAGLSAFTINPQSEQYAFDAMLPADSSILQDPFRRNRSGLQQTPPKRRRKAATMSDQRWEPASDRIRQLYVVEGKQIKEVREKINAEFGFDATERQYKARISKMKLERKCTIEQRKAILRHVQYRKERVGKESMHVCVRGHILTQEKIARWLKEPALSKELSNVRSPSPLPTEISIRTAVEPHSSGSCGETLSYIRFSDETEFSAALGILDNARQENQVMDPQQARGLFNDIQQLLETHHNPTEKMKRYGWRPSLEYHLVHIRNMMNLGPKLLVSGVSSSLTPTNSQERNQNNTRRLAKRDFKFTAWQTQHGRIELSFWSGSNDVNDETRARRIKYSTSADLARITIFTRSRTKSTICVNLEFNLLWDLPVNLTYQAMVPNDSEVFKIVNAGDVKALKKALAMKIASLTDRDEDGRSLLSYAATNARVDMCRFLLAHGADMNAMELASSGLLAPVHRHLNELKDYPVHTKENLKIMRQCLQIMLESGADLSLEQQSKASGPWVSSYSYSLLGDDYATFGEILLLGQPFVNANTRITDRDSYPLLELAFYCRWCYGAYGHCLDLLEKTILLLRSTADITVVDEECSNILHCVLKAKDPVVMGRNEKHAKAWMVATCDCDRCNAPFREPRQVLTAAIAAGADIYAFDKNGDTPTMTAKEYGRGEEWAEALEECGIDVKQVLLHTTEWENVLDKLDIKFRRCSSETRAKIVEDFESSPSNAGKMRQKSNLTFQQFCEQRDSRRKLRVECDYGVVYNNYWKMNKYLKDGRNVNKWDKGESQRSSEMSEIISKSGVLSHVEEEFEVHQGLQLARPRDTFTGDMEEDNDGRVFDILDDLARPVEHDDGLDNGDVYGSNGDLDMTEVYWGDDPFNFGSDCVGSPVMSFGEFMNIDEWNHGGPATDDVGD